MTWLQEQKAIQQASDDLRERIDASDRARARQRLRTAQSLTDYEKTLLGVEYTQYIRRQKAMREAARAAREQETRRRETLTGAVRPRDIVFRTKFIEQLSNHATHLLLKYSIRFTARYDGGGSASDETRTISAPPVTNESSYAIALHEIAHLIEPEADSRQFSYKIHGSSIIAPDGEAGAWRWAYLNALQWTKDMQAEMFRGLRSYAASATEEQRDGLRLCLINGALRIKDQPWSFKELDEHLARLTDAR